MPRPHPAPVRFVGRVILVVTMCVTVLIFWSFQQTLELSTRHLRQQGWLFDKAESVPFWSMWTEHSFRQVHWLRTLPSCRPISFPKQWLTRSDSIKAE